MPFDRRTFLKVAGTAAGGLMLRSDSLLAQNMDVPKAEAQSVSGRADYTLKIATVPVELARDRIVSATTYNGQFPGPLLRFKEGQQVYFDALLGATPQEVRNPRTSMVVH